MTSSFKETDDNLIDSQDLGDYSTAFEGGKEMKVTLVTTPSGI
jgi:hypothetical protein